MHYLPKLYARALAELVHKGLGEKEKTALVKNFLATIERNGDTANLKNIVEETDRLLREKQGIRKVTIETARPHTFDAHKLFGKFLEKSDVIEMKVKSDLVAGVRITVNDEQEFDMTLKRKLTKLFASSMTN